MPSQMRSMILQDVCLGKRVRISPLLQILRLLFFFGGVAKAGSLIVEPMREAMEENMLHLYKNRVEILFSSLSDAEAALLGASALAWDMSEI